ncbi:hypothetical protein P691DRAFT_586375 [Macrolepiota fuliginosa MF-IS2]|uniref:Integrase zinc-binding domain-containing protein n=1 Tax=Macrolepiota fuliginosa MF-IS2 TaxID=1400762 RepID=A0A9P5XDN3_9AGAR|nr:hypothetical protein P691DRAFT_586375 [Macrolepiota fuliginosa MF-IS2]
MSPERPSVRGSATSKPYTRTPSSSSVGAEDTRETTHGEYPQTPDVNKSDGEPGFPTRAQYQIIERGYIESLTPRRQGKALISQALFDRIWDVLHSTDNVKENAQFRFWVRKMFTLSKSHSASLGTNGQTRQMEQEVLLHDGLLVAVREQIYDLLCYCHGSTNHGGRDKTCALIRKHYTWVPKDLVAQFIKACPTCIVKKCGHSDTGFVSPRLGTSIGSPTVPAAQIHLEDVAIKQEPTSPLPSFKDYFNDVDGSDNLGQEAFSNSLPSTPIHTPHSQFTFKADQLNTTPIDELRRYNDLLINNPLPGFPMMREVSLYKGLPDGWQYQNLSYRNAHAGWTEYQRVAPILPYDPSLGRTHPRIPDVAPLFRPDFEEFINIKTEETDPVLSALDGSLDPTMSSVRYKTQSISPNLDFTGLNIVRSGSPMMPIDPFLLSLSGSMRSPSLPHAALGISTTPLSTKNDVDMASPSPAPPPFAPDNVDNDAGTVEPPALRLECLNPSNTFYGFLTIRDTLDEELMTPEDDDSKGKNCLWKDSQDQDDGNESGNSSPTGSVRSDVSQLSLATAIAAVTGPSSESPSTPNTTAPVTPVDEIPKEKAAIVSGASSSGGREGVD